MKTKIIIAAIALGSISIATTTAQTNDEVQKERSKDAVKTEKFKVYGNCGMCKERIEGSLKNIEWIYSAEWDIDTKIMSLTFDESNHTLDDVINKIAGVGHDTQWNSTKDEVYNKLPKCCQYDRKEKR
ncbi:MAG: heavy-metal-associated domain-containing protein [Bacteroidota bacterium]